MPGGVRGAEPKGSPLSRSTGRLAANQYKMKRLNGKIRRVVTDEFQGKTGEKTFGGVF